MKERSDPPGSVTPEMLLGRGRTLSSTQTLLDSLCLWSEQTLTNNPRRSASSGCTPILYVLPRKCPAELQDDDITKTISPSHF